MSSEVLVVVSSNSDTSVIFGIHMSGTSMKIDIIIDISSVGWPQSWTKRSNLSRTAYIDDWPMLLPSIRTVSKFDFFFFSFKYMSSEMHVLVDLTLSQSLVLSSDLLIKITWICACNRFLSSNTVGHNCYNQKKITIIVISHYSFLATIKYDMLQFRRSWFSYPKSHGTSSATMCHQVLTSRSSNFWKHSERRS